jgi:hypothetical protein
MSMEIQVRVTLVMNSTAVIAYYGFVSISRKERDVDLVEFPSQEFN